MELCLRKQSVPFRPILLAMAVIATVITLISDSAVTAADVQVGTPTGLPILASGVYEAWAVHSAVDDIHGFVYVVAKPYGSSTSSMYKVNISSNSLVSTLSLGTNYGGDVVLSPGGEKAYVAAWTEIIEIDLTTFAVARSHSVLSSGETYMPGIKSGIAINSLGTALYVVDLYENLRRVDLVSGAHAKVDSTCSSYKKPLTSPDGNYVYCIGQGALARYNALTLQQVDLVLLNDNFLQTFTIDGSGAKAYISGSASSRYVQASPLMRVDLLTMSVDLTTPILPSFGTCALEIDSTTKWLYAGGCDPGKLSKINLATLTVASIWTSDFVYDLDSSSTGVMYVMTSGNSQTNSPAAVTKRVTSATEPQSLNFGALSDVELWRESAELSATASSGLQVAYSSSTPLVCSISGTTVNFGAHGRCTVTGSQDGGDTGWDAADDISQSFDVVRQTVTFNIPSDVQLHEGLRNLSASASSGGTVIFSSSTNDVCTVSGAVATLKAYGTCTIAANQTTNGDSATEVSRSFQVKRQSISFVQPNDVFLSVGTVALSASASSGGTVAFSSSTNDVCTVSGAIVTLIKAGECTILANQNTNGDEAQEVATTFLVKPLPPDGEIGVSINRGSPYTNNKKVKVRIVWPFGATEVRISNDGGFASSTTQTLSLAEFADWELDDSISGVFTKVIYVRFGGPEVDRSKTYTDDIILDTTSPITSSVSGISAKVPGSSVTAQSLTSARKKNGVVLRVKAADRLSGIGSFEVKSSAKGKVVSVRAVSPKAKSHTVKVKTKARKIWLRSVDRAGNKSRWIVATVK